MTVNPKILVGIVTYDGKDYIFPKCYEAVRKLDYNNYDVLIVDNSKGSSYYSTLLRRGYRNVTHLRRAKNSRDTLSDSQNYLRKRVLDDGYDYLLMIESDLIPPPQTIKRLLSHNKLVVGSTYWLQANIEGSTEKASIPCIFFLDYKEREQAMGTRLIKPQELQQVLNTGLRTVHGCGLGCTLIARSIIEKYPFWTDERFTNKHSDVYFYMDLHNTHVPIYCDTDFAVPHYPSDWGQVFDR